MVERRVITDFLSEYLKIAEFQDITANGLQVGGASEIQRVGFAVDSSLKTLRLAVEKSCDMLVTHHGLIWHSWNKIDGTNRERLKVLLDSSLNLCVYHLPLDAHPECGNNAQLAKALQADVTRPFDAISLLAEWKTPLALTKLQDRIGQAINPRYQTLPYGEKTINKALICSGAWRSSQLEQLVRANIGTLLTGEPMGMSMFIDPAMEMGLNIIFAGHYETEVYGVKALMEVVRAHFQKELELVFIDNPQPMPSIPTFANG